MTPSPINCVVLCGPTASGKTRLGVQVASAFGGEIISADSRQVYRGMDIGTGKDLAEYENGGNPVPYHLIDVADPREIYSLWNYQQDFYKMFARLGQAGKLPVMVGGTGLYIEAVLKRYRIPDVPEDVEKRRELMARSTEDLLEELGRLDPAILEQTDVSSKKRVVRSLEVALYAQNHELRWGIPDPPEILPLILCIRTPRPELRERIDRRLESRFNEGMIEEVERLMSEGISRERLKQLGMEYGHIGRFLTGEVSRETMKEELRHSIHRFAKRQDTWFRGMERRGLPVVWLDGPDFDQAGNVLRDRLDAARS